MANPTWTPGYTPPYFQVHPFPRRQQSLPTALLQFITDLEATDNDVTNYADDEIHFRPNNTRNQPPTATEAPNPDAGDFFRITLSDGTEEVWEHDGTSWLLRATIEPNAATYSVVVNATGGTAQAFPMSTVAGGAVVIKAPTGFEITATDVGTIINGCVYFNMPANNQAVDITVAAVPPAPAPPVTDYTPITQAAHGIPARTEGFTPIYNDAGIWKLANAAGQPTIHDGFALNIATNTFDLVRDGFITAAGHGLTVGEDYFLQDNGNIGLAPGAINDIVCHVVDADTVWLIDNRPINTSAAGVGAPYDSRSAKWFNTDDTTNINTAAWADIPLFGTEQFNDDRAAFELVSPTQIRVNEALRIVVTSNLAFIGINSAGTTEQRTAVEARPAINGAFIPSASEAQTGYIRFFSGHAEAGSHIRETIDVAAGDVLSVQAQREANSGTVRMLAGRCNLSIEIVRNPAL